MALADSRDKDCADEETLYEYRQFYHCRCPSEEDCRALQKALDAAKQIDLASIVQTTTAEDQPQKQQEQEQGVDNTIPNQQEEIIELIQKVIDRPTLNSSSSNIAVSSSPSKHHSYMYVYIRR